MALVIFLLTFSLSAWSQSCPTAKTLSLYPVHDQDGMGTCASNTAALIPCYFEEKHIQDIARRARASQSRARGNPGKVIIRSPPMTPTRLTSLLLLLLTPWLGLAAGELSEAAYAEWLRAHNSPR